MFKIFKKKNNIPNILEDTIELAIETAIKNKRRKNNIIKKSVNSINFLKQIGNILISCPICKYSFYLEKGCGVTRCCNSKKSQSNTEELCNKISNEELQHCSKKECDKLRKTYPNACLTPLLILTVGYYENDNIIYNQNDN